MNIEFLNFVPTAFFIIIFGLFIGRPRSFIFLSARVQRAYGVFASFLFDVFLVFIIGFIFFWLVLFALTFLHEVPICAP